MHMCLEEFPVNRIKTIIKLKMYRKCAKRLSSYKERQICLDVLLVEGHLIPRINLS